MSLDKGFTSFVPQLLCLSLLWYFTLNSVFVFFHQIHVASDHHRVKQTAKYSFPVTTSLSLLVLTDFFSCLDFFSLSCFLIQIAKIFRNVQGIGH